MPVNVPATPGSLPLPPASLYDALASAFVSHTNAGHWKQVLRTVAALCSTAQQEASKPLTL